MLLIISVGQTAADYFTWRIFDKLRRNIYYTYWYPESRSGIWIQWMQGQAT